MAQREMEFAIRICGMGRFTLILTLSAMGTFLNYGRF